MAFPRQPPLILPDTPHAIFHDAREEAGAPAEMSDELFTEKMLRTSTRAFAEFLASILPMSGDTFQQPVLAHCILEVRADCYVVLLACTPLALP